MSESDELAQKFISDERFREWFTKLDFPEPGEDGILPTLFVASLPAQDGDALDMMLIAIAGDAFKDTKQRFAIMRGLGARCCDAGAKPVAVALISEVWMRAFTPEEAKARGKRQISDYDDREEWVMLCGATIDGRAAMIRAPIVRNADAIITGYGPRSSSLDEKSEITEVEADLLMAFFKGYLAKKFEASPAHVSH